MQLLWGLVEDLASLLVVVWVWQVCFAIFSMFFACLCHLEFWIILRNLGYNSIYLGNVWKSTKHGPKQEIWVLRWIYLGHPVLFCVGAWKLPQVSLMCHQTSRGTGFAKESKGTLGALDSKMNPFEESCPFLNWCVETSSEVPKMCIMKAFPNNL